MSNIKTLLDVVRDAARGNDMHYCAINRREQANDLLSIDPTKWPLCCVMVPSTSTADAEPADHRFEVLILDVLKQTDKVETNKNSNDYLHAQYKALDDKFYQLVDDIEGNSTNAWFIPVGDFSINRLEPSQLNAQYIGIAVTFTLRGEWYCPGGESPTGVCDPVTVTDGDDTTSVSSGGSYTCAKTQISTFVFPVNVEDFTITWQEAATYTSVPGNLSADGVEITAPFVTVSGTTAEISRPTPTTGLQTFVFTGTYA